MQVVQERQSRGHLLLVGLLLLLIGIAGFIYASYSEGMREATNPVGGPGHVLTIQVPRGLKISDTGIVRVQYEFTLPPEYPVDHRTVTVTLQAPSFKVNPPAAQPISKRISQGIPDRWLWVIYPEALGQHQVVVQFQGLPGPLLATITEQLKLDSLPENTAIMNTQDKSLEEIIEENENPKYSYDLVVPITVVDLMGLTALQAKLFSSAATFVGSGFTVAWVYEQWRKLREGKAKKQRPQRTRKNKGRATRFKRK